MNILYLADPSSIHDRKWISYLAKGDFLRSCILSRDVHRANIKGSFELDQMHIGFIPDFSILRFWRTLFTAFRIKKIIKEREVVLVHILYAEPNALWCIFRWYFGVPMVITTRGTDVLKTIPEAFAKRNLINILVAPLYRLSFKLADRITSTSERQKESIREFSGRTEGITIIRTGVNVKLIEELKYSHSVFGHKKFILFPRLIKPVYNHEFCLEAIRELKPSVQATHKMVFVGKDCGDRNYQEMLENKMREMPAIDFAFLEKQSQVELIALYYNASLVVMTPKSDGSPVSAMEAMLCGAKVVLGPLEYDTEIFSSINKIKNWDARELARAIEDSLTQEQTSQGISCVIKQLIDTSYNMNKILEIYGDLAHEVK